MQYNYFRAIHLGYQNAMVSGNRSESPLLGVFSFPACAFLNQMSEY